MKWQECLRRLAEAREIVYDVETSGLSWQKNHAVGHVLTFGSAPQDSYYIPLRHAAGGNLEGCSVPQTKDGWDGSIHPFEVELVKLMDRPDLKILYHNGSFDLKFKYRLGFKFQAKAEDSMINQALLNEYSSSFSLDACAGIMGVQRKKVEIYEYLVAKFPELKATPKQAMGHFWRLAGDDPQAVEYAEQDGTTTWLVREKQAVELEKQDLLKVHDVECRLIPVLARMTTKGIKVDEERLHQVKKIVEDKRDTALKALPPEFNSRAPTQVKALMEGGGFTDWPLTPTGKPSFPEKWLITNPIGNYIVDVRRYSNLLNSFIEPMINDHLWKGRVHSEYNQLRGDEYGTITGRLSSSHPNNQQIPKRNVELGRLFRSIYVPDEGMIWGSVDYSQCEPRLLAYYSRCAALVDKWKEDPKADAHLSVAQAINSGKWEGFSDAEKKYARENGKRVNQTLITGGGKKVIVERYGVPFDEVDQIWKDYFKAMPEIQSLQRRASEKMYQRGFVISLLGRRARLSDPKKSYVAVNRLLQCGNADILKLKMVEIDDYLKSEGRPIDLLTNVHDALDYQFSEVNRKHYDHCLEIMTSFGEQDVIKLDVPMVVDAGEGSNWSIATYGAET